MVSSILPKNERKSSAVVLRLGQKLIFLVRFFEELKTENFPFEITWPLVRIKFCKYIHINLFCLQQIIFYLSIEKGRKCARARIKTNKTSIKGAQPQIFLRQAQRSRNRTWPEMTHWLMVPEGLSENLGKGPSIKDVRMFFVFFDGGYWGSI